MARTALPNMGRDPSLQAFSRVVGVADGELDLGLAALEMARFEYPSLVTGRWESELEWIGESSRAAVTDSPVPAVALAEHLFRDMGFTGNAGDYHDPRNSFLNQVLERRLGIPITLSVVYLDVARRLGIAAQGVGLPGHFIVRAGGPGSPVLIDPFHGGALLSIEDCRRRVDAITGGKLPFHEEYLAPVSSRYILARMLNNLKNIYAQNADLERTLAVVQRLLVLRPDDPIELRNLGLVLMGMGRRRDALSAFERSLEAGPDEPGADTVRRHIEQLAQDLARWN